MGSIRYNMTRRWYHDTGHVIAEAWCWFDGLFYTWSLDDGRRGIAFRYKTVNQIVHSHNGNRSQGDTD